MGHQVVGLQVPGQGELLGQTGRRALIQGRVGSRQVGQVAQVDHQRPQAGPAPGPGKVPNLPRRHRTPFPGPGVLPEDLQRLAAQDLGLGDGPQQRAGDG